MGRRSSNSLLVSIIIIAIISAITAFFSFIANNILIIVFGALVVFSLYILIKQLSKRKPISHPGIKKPQRIPTRISRKTKHPLYDILLYIVNSYGVNLFNDVQKYRGLLKDYAKNEYKDEVKYFIDLLTDGIPYKIINLTGKRYRAKIISDIYKANYSNSMCSEGYKDAISLLFDILLELKLLKLIAKEDSEKPVLKIKIYYQENFPIFAYYFKIILFYIKSRYKIIIPMFLLISSSLLLFLNTSYKWKTHEKINYNDNKINVEQIEPEPIKKYAYVNSYVLNMRNAPSASSSIITQLLQNDKVEIITVTGAWSMVVFNSYKGYVNSLYLSDNQVLIQTQQPLKQGTPKPSRQSIPVIKKLDLAEKEVKEKE